jgi:hypothetical protein
MAEIIITIDQSTGDMLFLETSGAQAFKALGRLRTRRASHVEPYEFWPRVAFTAIRMLVSDSSRVTEWIRNWNTLWRVNMKPVGGPILTWSHIHPKHIAASNRIYPWGNRQEAIEAEVKFLNQFFLERTI